MPKLVFDKPSPDAPGYLRRTRRLQEIQEMPPSLATLDILIEFLLDFVTEPERDEARELLLDLSQNELKELSTAVVGADNGPLSPETPRESLPGGIKASSGQKRRSKA